ncbi:MAG: VOC family protein [Actinomycetota bacterium]
MAAVKPIPDGYPEVTPYLYVDGAEEAIEFYRTVFGVRERMRLPGPDGKIGHCELELGSSLLMVAEESPAMGALGPRSVGGTPVALSVYVEDADGVFSRAVEAGATVVQPLETQFYGDRAGLFEDPFGHRWHVATHVEEVSPEEMARRAAEVAASGGGG